MQVADKLKFDELAGLVGDLQSLGCVEILTESREDIKFELQQERLLQERQRTQAAWFYKTPDDSVHGPFEWKQLSAWSK